MYTDDVLVVGISFVLVELVFFTCSHQSFTTVICYTVEAMATKYFRVCEVAVTSSTEVWILCVLTCSRRSVRQLYCPFVINSSALSRSVDWCYCEHGITMKSGNEDPSRNRLHTLETFVELPWHKNTYTTCLSDAAELYRLTPSSYHQTICNQAVFLDASNIHTCICTV